MGMSARISQRLISLTLFVVLGLCCTVISSIHATAEDKNPSNAKWIWSGTEDIAPKNRFTYFRKTITLEKLPANAELHFAADSNARLWINGHLVRRKVARYHESQITAEIVNAAPYLKPGGNVIVALHHNWGSITTFQRTGNLHAGLYIDSAWLKTDASWRCLTAPEFLPHEDQIVGVIGHARIRYAMVLDAQKQIGLALHTPAFDDSAWSNAVEIEDGPWPASPSTVETPGQREYPVSPMHVLAAGKLKTSVADTAHPLSIAGSIKNAELFPDDNLTKKAAALLDGKDIEIAGHEGESYYITFDFYRPVHGYPFVDLADAPEGVLIDLGYAEIARSLYSGEDHVKPNGWINPEGVVGPGYADRLITANGPQQVEFPDERTTRWLAVHIHFNKTGKINLRDIGFVKSQYPIEPAGTFSCGNERIEQIVKLCLIHAEITMTDAYIDTPGREDGQWIEDDRPRALIAARWFGDTRLREFLIRTHAEGQGQDGDFHPFSPSNFPAYPASFDWSVQWVAALYDDYQWTGETTLIRTYWDNLCRYWKRILEFNNEEGVWLSRRIYADIRMGPRCENDHQSSGMVTPWIIERLRWSAEMAKALGENDQAAQWTATAQKMSEAFRKYHIVPANGEIPLHVANRFDLNDSSIDRGYSQAGQTVAILSGLLNKKEAHADLDYAFQAPDGDPPNGVSRWNNPTYGYRSLHALSQSGLTQRAVAHLLERYAPYLPQHPRNQVPQELQGPYGGPLPEYWVSREDLSLEPGETNSAQPSDETGSHGWGAVPLLWLHDSLLGVEITKPGGAELRIAPNDGGLPYVAGHTITPKGLVWVYWDPQQWTLEVNIPNGVTAEIVMPPVCAQKRTICLSHAAPIQELNTDEAGRSRFKISGGGEYVFAVR